jgi:hypothetical protein
VTGPVRRAVRALRDFLAVQAELHERMGLCDRPWEEELLHWSADGRLHGTLSPPPGRRRSTTRGGWCPGLAADRAQAAPQPGTRTRA